MQLQDLSLLETRSGRVHARRAGGWISRAFDRLQVTKLFADSVPTAVPAAIDRTRFPYVVFFSLTGTIELTYPGGRLTLPDRHYSILPASAHIRLAAGYRAEVILVYLPREGIAQYSRVLANAAGCVYGTESGTASLVTCFIAELAEQLEDYSPTNPARLAQHVTGLLALMCADNCSRPATNGGAEILDKAKEFIEENLADQDLTPERIAAAQHISARTLHRLFEGEDHTLGSWIRERRLERCRLDLIDPGLQGQSISRVAAHWGMWDAAHFSRVFKAHYGLPPRAYRIAHQQDQFSPHTRSRRDELCEIA